MLAPEAIRMRPIPERHRIIFYIGHLEAFDWNMIGAWAFGMPSFNSEFDRLFAFGIDPVDGKLPQDRPADWPSLDHIALYCERIRTTIDKTLEKADLTPALAQIVNAMIEHRLMHAETLAYMLHWLDFGLKRNDGPSAVTGTIPKPANSSAVRVPAGRAMLGRRTDESFGWDNEFNSHSVFVPEFSLDSMNVTNGAFLEFVNAGGYRERSLWSAEGWEWLNQAGVSCPKFWVCRNESWFYRTMFEEIPMPLNWPVYVSYSEASAYAMWKGRSLPSEAQYHRAAFGESDAPVTADGNFGSRSWSPLPVGSFPPSPLGFFDLVGNGWEWTSTPFAPFDGFKPFAFYPGYSADFFDGRHFVLKGASPRTPAALVRTSFRNWFQPYYPNVYATFRCADPS
jgi:ergothioneine biosynthesis protein EgtB